jgi:hypothetical protein
MNESQLKLLLNCLNSAMDNGWIPDDWKVGIISTIFKSGDKDKIDNRRPITLLRVDYKILSKILTKRLNNFMNLLINPLQIGFVHGRSIYDNVIILDQMIKKKSTKIISIDFQKAYDSISHQSIAVILHHIGLPDKFVNIVKNLLKRSSACVKIGNQITEFFKIKKGVKQGDPISPLLFNLVIELLNKNAKRIIIDPPNLNNFPIPICLYADDIVLFGKNDFQINQWCEILNKFQSAIGILINQKKSFTLFDDINFKNIKLDKITTNSFKYLGFNFSPLTGLIDDFDKTINHCSNLLNRWFKSDHNIFQKLSILKTYALSFLWYKSFILGNDDGKLDKMIASFLWKNKNNSISTKVSKKRAKQHFLQGGISMWDFKDRFKAFKANLIEKIRFSVESKTYKIYESDFTKINSMNLNIFKLNLFKNNLILNNAWKCWIQINKKLPENKLCDIDSYQSIKKLQETIHHNQKIILTPRQMKLSVDNDMKNIFLFIKFLKDRELANFLWLYFQGGLPFSRRTKCVKDNINLSHAHIFENCVIGDDSHHEALIISAFLETDAPPLMESKFWELISDGKIPLKNKIIAALTLYNKWLNKNSLTRKTKIVDSLNILVTHELSYIKSNFTNQAQFENQLNLWRSRWNIKNLWNKKHNILSFKHITV